MKYEPIYVLLVLTMLGSGCQSNREEQLVILSDKQSQKLLDKYQLTMVKQNGGPISQDDANALINSYKDYLKQIVYLADSATGKPTNKSITLRKLLHDNICQTCDDIYPSYMIDTTFIKAAIGQKHPTKKVKNLQLYPAIRIVDSKKVFTLVVLAADDTSTILQKPKTSSFSPRKDDNKIFEYINPCPPPVKCQNIK